MKQNHTAPPIQTVSRRAAISGLLALPLAALAAETPGSADAELLLVRERVWRDWFAGDRKALTAILPKDFVGFGAGGGPGRTKTETIADAEGFVSGGGKLTNLGFSSNRIQRLGSVSVIYCNFTFTTANKSGASTTITGRATEVFVHNGSGWTHPGWHLEQIR